MGLARARFCELLSSRLQSKTDLFLMGLLSVMDAVLEVSMDVLLEQLPVERETKAVLLGQNSSSPAALPPHAGAGIGGVGGIERLAKELKLPDEEVALPGFRPCSGRRKPPAACEKKVSVVSYQLSVKTTAGCAQKSSLRIYCH
jgi:hypothetical protein